MLSTRSPGRLPKAGQGRGPCREAIENSRRAPSLDVDPRTNRVIKVVADEHRDGVSVWLDHNAKDPDERFRMFILLRTSRREDWEAGNPPTSPDGIHWARAGHVGPGGDNTSFFYNPFRNKWVFSIRTHRAGRTRDYC